MRQTFIFLLLILTACDLTNYKPKETPVILKEEPIINTSISEEKSENIPDNSFEYFLFNFGISPEFQKSRIRFPLESNSKTNVSYIDSIDWKIDPLFSILEAVTNVSNGLDSKIKKEGVFSWVNTKSLESRNYYFEKVNENWFLVKISTLKDTAEASPENFYSFLSNFCSDSVFQVQRINFPVKVTRLDDEYESVTESITLEKWRFMSVYYNCDSIATTFNNFERQFADTDERILEINGVENGINAFLKFKRIDNKWMLIESNDSST